MAVSEAENNEKIDADILQCKDDVLRARDIIPASPSYRKKPHKEPDSSQKTQNTTQSANTAEYVKQERFEIPKLDLAEDIMTEQRKITAIRRKAPGKKTEAQSREPKAEPISYTIEQPLPASPEQERIIAEIVARDIERLRRGDNPGIQAQNFRNTDLGAK